MNSYVSDLQASYCRHLTQAGFAYLKNGLVLFHEYRRMREYVSPQAAIGNLGIAVELMLKAFIAGKDLSLLFKGLPLEVRVLFACPDSLPSRFNWRALDIDLRSAHHRMIEFNDCLSVFYLFFPEMKSRLQSHLKFLASSRNACVHAFLPSFERYEAERTAYVALQVHQTLNNAKAFEYPGFLSRVVTDEDARFLEAVQGERLERVQKAVAEARERGKKLTGQPSIVLSISDEWNQEIVSCPICGSDAILGGFTDLLNTEPEQNGDMPDAFLQFYPESFLCDECGLTLDDCEELLLAGIPIDSDEFDRTDRMGEYYAEIAMEHDAAY